MATQKKGQGISFLIPGQAPAAQPTEPAVTAPAAPVTAPAAGTQRYQPKTGIGLLSRVISDAQGDSEEVARLSAEVAHLKLQVGEQLIDPALVRLTRWADRHPDSFTNSAFAELKADIGQAGGNVQPIKVRPIPGAPVDGSAPRFELVFGSRRTRACMELGLKVRAVVEEGVDDQDLYVQMQRENRGRANLSAWEQGVSYHRALEEGLFSSARKLADAVGVDQSNVSKALRVAALPEEVVGAFASPVDIQFRWAAALDQALSKNAEAVRAAARAVHSSGERPGAAEVFKRLTQAPAQQPAGQQRSTATGVKVKIGTDGGATISIPAGGLGPEKRVDFEKAVAALLKRFGL